jgi:uncharacterized repeat protein (TIGR01451 family)
MMRFFFISCLIFVCFGGAFGQDTFINDTLDVQWDSLKMPKTGPSFERYYRSGKKLFALDYARTNIYGRGGTARFYESSDDGKIWKEKKDHIVGEIYVKDSIVLIARCLYKSSSYYNNFEYVYGNLSFELSEDFGVTYKTVFNKHVLLEKAGAQIYPGDKFDGFFEVGDSSIYCSVYGSPSNNEQLISNNRGKNWSKIDAKLFYNSQDNAGKPFSKIINGKAYLITNDKIYSTRNSDFIWTDSIPLPQEMPYYYSFSVKDNIYTLYCYNRKKMSTNDNGINWRSDSLPFTLNNGDDVFQKNNKIYIKLSNRIYQSDDGYFNNYQRIYPPNLPFNQVLTGFSVMDSVMYLNGNNRTLIKSKDNGQTWETIDDTKQLTFSKFAFFGENVLFKAANGTFYKSTNDFKTLSSADSSNLIPYKDTYQSLNILPSLKNGNTWLMAFPQEHDSYRNGLLRSFDNGVIWDTLLFRGEIRSIGYNSKKIYAISSSYSSYYLDISYDNGRTFINSKLPTQDNYYNTFYQEDTLFAYTKSNNYIYIWYSIDDGVNWQQKIITLPTMPSDQYRNDIITHDSKGFILIRDNGNQIFNFTHLGETLIQQGQIPKSTVFSADYYGTYKGYLLYYVYNNDSINLIITGDYGMTWTAIKKRNDANYFKISENYLQALSISNTPSVIYRTCLDSIINKVKAVSDYSILKGQIFKDKNENCQKDTTENGIAEKTIRIMPRNYTTITDKNGRFAVALPPDTYTISTSNIQYHKATCGDTILKNITLKANEKRDTQIVFKQSEKAYDLSVSLSTGSRARPGFEVDFVLKTQNLGTENIDSALITLDVPSNLEFKEANQNGVFKNNQIVWTLKNSAVDDNKIFTARLRLAPTTPLSIPIVFKAKGTIFNQKDTFPLNNIDSVRLNVTGSFDPNDKTVLPEGKIPFFTNELDYLIRFQNTGNDTAFKVVVVDTLPPQLDVVSLKTISASHPYVVSLKKNIITFTFDNILLPDSNVNERASHGFIRFKLKPQNGLKVGDNINNKAAIYFDYNKPIITNTAQLELIKPMIIVPQSQTLCKGDSYKNKPYFENTIVYDTIKSLLYDTTFMTSIDIKPTYQVSKDTILKANEKLFNKNVENGEIVILKLKTALGCDSSITYKVSKLSTETQELPEGFASIKIYPNPVKDYLSISYELNKTTFVEIALYNSIGQKVKILREKGQNTEGVHRLDFDVKDLQEGWYQLTIVTEKGIFGQRFIKVK